MRFLPLPGPGMEAQQRALVQVLGSTCCALESIEVLFALVAPAY